MSVIPPGHAAISLELAHASMPRSAFLTWAVTPNGVAAADIANKVLLAVMTPAGSLFSIIDSNVTIVSATARVGQDGGEPIVYVAESGAVGGKGGATLPPNCAVLVHKRTARGGRRGRGRMFIPWASGVTDVGESGILGSTHRTTLQTCMNTFHAACVTQGVPMTLLHSNSEPGTDNPTPPGLPDPVTSLLVDSIVSTQRRRLGR